MLTAGTHGVEHRPQGQIEGDIVLVAADDAEEVQSELCEVVVLDGQCELEKKHR